MSTAELRKACKDAGIRQGIISIRKTQFVTHWTAAVALDKNLQLIKNLIQDGKAKLKVCLLLLHSFSHVLTAIKNKQILNLF